MCGICGFISKKQLTNRDILNVNEMNKALYHRGPDSDGFYKDTNVALAMRRLKIIDIEGGNQPIFNENGSIVLVANGEIYNHLELRKELEERRHRFNTRSDSEVILHMYEERGTDCVSSLRGMFAFAIYDKSKHTILLARDRMGEKPLYYYSSDSEIVFSSEMKSILTYLRPKGIRLNPDALNMYFHYQYVPEPYTCIDGINKLPAAHLATISLADMTFDIKEYWKFGDISPLSGDPEQLIRESFDEMSRMIIRADVPVGISLSGGIDSTAIAIYAAKHYKNSMHAFSVGYTGRPKNDERKMAEDLAKKIGMKFHEIELRAEDLVSFFPDLVYDMDDPIADIAAFAYHSVNKLAKEHNIPVLLNGFGGDELFWGYEWTRQAVEKNILKKKIGLGQVKKGPFWTNFFDVLNKTSKKKVLLNPIQAAKKIIIDVNRKNSMFIKNPKRFIFYADIPDFVNASDYKKNLFSNEFMSAVDENLIHSFFTTEDWDSISIKLCEFLSQTWLISNCVALGDRMSMSASVESRLPFLDHKFVETVIGLRKSNPDEYKLGYKKWFIDAMKDIIPEEVLNRKKRGFTPPVKEWYLAIVKKYAYLCFDGYLVSNNLFNKKAVIFFIETAIKGKNDLFFAYKIVLMEIWCRKFVEGKDEI